MTYTLPTPKTPLNIGTRGSPLALAQAYETRARLAKAFDLPLDAFEIVVITTTGDRIIDRPLKEIGGKGLFTREIEQDMPVQQPDGLMLDTYLPREDVRDAFISLSGGALRDLSAGAVVGTSSLRRQAQLKLRRPDLQVVEFRGNLQTRLKKLENQVAEATFLAMAGLKRLKMDEVQRQAIEVDDMLPAVAQGAIGIERRINDMRMADMLAAIHDQETGQRLAAERAFLAALDGSCETPIAGLSELQGSTMRLRGEVLRPDGSDAIQDDIIVPIEDGAQAGQEMAAKLLERAGEGFFDWRES
jgi:hydroxymethylbilane synthase